MIFRVRLSSLRLLLLGAESLVEVMMIQDPGNEDWPSDAKE